MVVGPRPLVSIVVPVYKAERFLDVCVESLLAQTYSNLELILVDDGSPDDCPRMCDAWADRDPRIVSLHTTNEGASAARNAGKSQAQGDYLMFVDSDDVLSPTAVEQAMSVAQKTGSELVIFGKRYIDEQGAELRVSVIDQDIVCEGEAYYDQLAYLLRRDYLSPPWGKLFARRIVEGLSFDTDMVYEEDLAFNIKVLRRKPSVYAMHDALYGYRHMDSGMASAYSERKVRNIIDANRLKDSLFAGKLGEAGLRDLSTHIANDIGWIIPQITDALNVPINKRVDDIMAMVSDEVCHRYIKSGIKEASLSKALKLLMVVNNRWMWRKYTEMHDKRGR